MRDLNEEFGDRDKRIKELKDEIEKLKIEAMKIKGRVGGLKTHNFKYKDEIERLKLDKARLDWLQEKETSLYTVTHEERVPNTSTHYTHQKQCVFDGWSVGIRRDEVDTVREAIDLGMKNAEPKKSCIIC